MGDMALEVDKLGGSILGHGEQQFEASPQLLAPLDRLFKDVVLSA